MRILDRAALDARLRGDLTLPGVLERYWDKVVREPDHPGLCWIWTGALDDKGHGRFRIGKHVYLAHRVGWAIAHPGETVPELLAHDVCDLPLCQYPDHTEDSTVRGNTQSYEDRRRTPGASFRDTRGARGLSRAIRAGVLGGLDIRAAIAAAGADGLSELDRNQGTLW